ncbi:MAG: hypothetical protein JWO52_7819 [Gammaproteobacteria bacterium]|nr:hypothetical protein [Gammaproteobacteria bacterium]
MSAYFTVRDLKNALANADDNRLVKIELRDPQTADLEEVFWITDAGGLKDAHQGPGGTADLWVIDVVDDERA